MNLCRACSGLGSPPGVASSVVCAHPSICQQQQLPSHGNAQHTQIPLPYTPVPGPSPS